MTPRKRKATLQKEEPPAKRPSKGRAAKKQDDPVWATQNSNSHLVDQDLHAKYCDPATYQNWTKEDWEEIRDCLPENAPYNDDGYSVPMHFFRHDPDWRRLVREFQDDLGAGRYEPQWLKQAALAMEERAAGKFDKFKEDQFEAFWGQKQTSSQREVRAGESAKIKLPQLVEAGLIKVGDDLSYRRTFRSKAGDLLMIEKDLKVVSINGTTLTVAIPPGQHKYHHLQNQPKSSVNAPADDRITEKEANQRDKATERSTGDHVFNGSNPTSKGANTGTETSNDSMKDSSNESELQTSVDSSNALKVLTPEILRSNGNFIASQVEAKPSDARNAAESEALPIGTDDERNDKGAESFLGHSEAISTSHLRTTEEDLDKDKARPAVDESEAANLIENTAIDEIPATGHSPALETNEQASNIDSVTGCFLYDVWKPQGLENRVIEIDGRMDPKDAPIASSWRYIRVLRNNQDLGSLFDIREELYVWNSSSIVKTPKKANRKGHYQLEDEGSKEYTEKSPKKSKVLTPKRGSQGIPPFDRQSGRSRTAKGKGTDASDDDDDVAKNSEDDESIAERESDGEFIVKARPTEAAKQQSKRRGRPKGSTSRTTKTPVEMQPLAYDDQKGDSKEDEEGRGELNNETEDREFPSRRVHQCPYCGNGFTQECNMKKHIRAKRCKKLPAE